MSIETADYQYLSRRLVKFLGIPSNASPEGDVVAPDALYTADLLKKQLIQSDGEVQLVIASVEDHPYRNAFFTVEPAEIANDARIPAYMGVHGGVKVGALVKKSLVWKDGRLAQSFAHLDRSANKFTSAPNLLADSSKWLYWIENGKIKLLGAGFQAKVSVPTITFGSAADVSPTLGTPRLLQNAVLAHAISTLRPVGADSTHRAAWTEIWTVAKQMIEGKNLNIPDPEQLQRLGT